MKLRWFLLSIAALALLALAGLWLRDAVRPEPLNVIFLTVESWRADTAEPGQMPNLFQAARQGTRFTKHRAISAWTAPNIIAVLTGLSPFEQGVHARGQSVSPDHRLLLEELADSGWRVAGLQSFMTIDVFANLGVTVTPKSEPLPWLAGRARDRQPFVLWHHYLKTHLPYAPPEPYRQTYDALSSGLDDAARARMAIVASAPAIPDGSVAFMPSDAPAVRALYDGGIAEFDDWFGAFWDFFNASGLRETTVLIVTADHGEEILERGNVGHASTTRAGHLHEEIVRIPLFVWVPARVAGTGLPKVVDTATAHTDIVPELRRLLGQRQDGPDRPVLYDTAARDRPRISATSFGGFAEPDPGRPSGFEIALRDRNWKLRLRQAAGGVVLPYLYDLGTDPGERHNLAENDAGRVRAMSREILPELHRLWVSRVPDDSEISSPGGQNSSGGQKTSWIMPRSGGVLRFADIADGVRLEWTGNPAGRYVIEYQAGEGALRIEGALDVTGTVKDFGEIGETYWRTWIVPYGRVRLRVVPDGRADRASEWVEMAVLP